MRSLGLCDMIGKSRGLFRRFAAIDKTEGIQTSWKNKVIPLSADKRLSPQTQHADDILGVGWVDEIWPLRARRGSVASWHDELSSSRCDEVRAKKTSLILNLGTNGLKVTSEPPPTAGGLLVRTGSLSGHPSEQQPRSTLLDPLILL
ncbi:hypothetical protein J6590_035104 [Homalodisca vitripennis]|nr:hypothetical protein J6590_035104 [Homalodisca vitripennis]